MSYWYSFAILTNIYNKYYINLNSKLRYEKVNISVLNKNDENIYENSNKRFNYDVSLEGVAKVNEKVSINAKLNVKNTYDILQYGTKLGIAYLW